MTGGCRPCQVASHSTWSDSRPRVPAAFSSWLRRVSAAVAASRSGPGRSASTDLISSRPRAAAESSPAMSNTVSRQMGALRPSRALASVYAAVHLLLAAVAVPLRRIAGWLHADTGIRRGGPIATGVDAGNEARAGTLARLRLWL